MRTIHEKLSKDFCSLRLPEPRRMAGQFAAQAIARGAIAVVSEAPEPPDFDGLWVRVAHGRQALAAASGNFYRHPDRRLKDYRRYGHQRKNHNHYLIIPFSPQRG